MSAITKKTEGFYRHTAAELRDLVISVLVLSLGFTIALFGGIDAYQILFDPAFPLYFTAILLIVGFSLVLREMTQKMTARSMEAHLTYQMWPSGIVLALLTSFLGFVFAAVGRGIVSSEHTERFSRWRITLTPQQMALMASIGPLLNLAIAIAFLMLAPLFAIQIGGESLFILGAEINAVIALSTLLPMASLDGEKILRWSASFWIFNVLLAVAVLLMTYGIL